MGKGFPFGYRAHQALAPNKVTMMYRQLYRVASTKSQYTFFAMEPGEHEARLAMNADDRGRVYSITQSLRVSHGELLQTAL